MKASIPMTKAISRPIAKLRFSSRRGSRNGCAEVRLCAAKIQKAIAATAASRIISGDSNQSRRWPRSIISCTPVIATDKARNPVQSRRVRVRSVYPENTNQMKAIASSPGGTIMKNTARQS